ncbi:hypothetical protein B0H13DRAFT_2020384 [Mycena leptocephala]|nr:hypothetical protein B0H13DRAFT_2020384 [Mycena leptocephala]
MAALHVCARPMNRRDEGMVRRSLVVLVLYGFVHTRYVRAEPAPKKCYSQFREGEPRLTLRTNYRPENIFPSTFKRYLYWFTSSRGTLFPVMLYAFLTASASRSSVCVSECVRIHIHGNIKIIPRR